jgi:hypothetical protein
MTTNCDAAAVGAVAVRVRAAGLACICEITTPWPFSGEAASSDHLIDNTSARKKGVLEIERQA